VPPSITYDTETIGFNSQGILVHLFGSNTVNTTLTLGTTATGSGTYNLYSFGTLTVGRDESIGLRGTGRVTQFGGTNMVTRDLYLGFGSTGSGTYHLKAAVSRLMEMKISATRAPASLTRAAASTRWPEASTWASAAAALTTSRAGN
jgi:hypothetical protein